MNDYYNHTTFPSTGSAGASAPMRSELDAIDDGFDKLAPLAGNAGKFILVNSSGTAQALSSTLSETGGILSIAGTIALTTAESIRIKNDVGSVTFWNTANSTRTGYLQGVTGTSMILAAESGNSLELGAGGVIRARINPAGEFGIGQTATAGYRLDVNGTIRSIGGEATTGYGIRVLNAATNGGGSITALTGAAAGLQIDSDAGPIYLNANGATRVRINTNGLVGVGRTATTKNLEVQGGILAGISDVEALRVVNDAGSVTFWNGANGTRTGYLQGVAGAGLLLIAEAGNTLSLGAGGATRITVNAAGEAGVGRTATAGYLLDVNGTIRSIGGEATTGYGIRVLNAATNGGGSITALTGAAAGLVIDSDSGPMFLNAGGATRVRVSAGGLVGVGRTATTKNLEVQGGILAGVSDIEALRVVNDAGYVAFWDSANGTRTGYLQGVTATSVILAAEIGNSLQFLSGASLSAHLFADGRVFLNRIHNNAAGASGTTPMAASGNYTPTLTNVANATGLVSASFSWLRVGNVVEVSGQFTSATTLASNTTTQIGISLPIPSDLAAASDCAGTGARNNGGANEAGLINSDTANNRAALEFKSTNVAAFPVSVKFSYTVL